MTADLPPADKLLDQQYRLNHLYTIIQKDPPKPITFRMNPQQEQLYREMAYRNIILKARQIGFTTLIQLYMLDCCMFYPNIEAGIIAHTKTDAQKFFHKKIKYAYKQLHPSLQTAIETEKDDGGELRFANNSAISVGTSLRSTTLNLLHLSEFGKVCAQYPLKAQEIITGALNAVTPNGRVFVESTAEGQSGRFFDMCELSRQQAQENMELTSLDFKFHFFPWWEADEYALDAPSVLIPGRLVKYFNALEPEIGRKLTNPQRVWYTKMEQTQGDLMKREYPATPDEAFEQAIEGAYYSTQMRWLREHGRLCSVPLDTSTVVDTWWDIGYHDYMAIWFTQTIGRAVHIIDYYENSGEGFEHYFKVMKDRKYRYGKYYAPHDIDVHDVVSGERRINTIAKRFGIDFQVVAKHNIQDGIEQVRTFMSLCWFDKEKCGEGIIHLDSYKKKWDDVAGRWSDKPMKSNHNHCADAFRTLAVGHDFHRGVVQPNGTIVPRRDTWGGSV